MARALLNHTGDTKAHRGDTSLQNLSPSSRSILQSFTQLRPVTVFLRLRVQPFLLLSSIPSSVCGCETTTHSSLELPRRTCPRITQQYKQIAEGEGFPLRVVGAGGGAEGEGGRAW